MIQKPQGEIAGAGRPWNKTEGDPNAGKSGA
jgi:hypothetical protein